MSLQADAPDGTKRRPKDVRATNVPSMRGPRSVTRLSVFRHLGVTYIGVPRPVEIVTGASHSTFIPWGNAVTIPEQARPKTYANAQLTIAVEDVISTYEAGMPGQVNSGFEVHWMGEYLDVDGTIRRRHYAWHSETGGCGCGSAL